MVATRDTLGAVTAVLAGELATMLPLPLVTLNSTVALETATALLSVNVSVRVELSFTHRLPCPVAVPVVDALNSNPPPPLFSSSGLVDEVPTSPFVATNPTAGAVTAVLPGRLATILPLVFVTPNATAALNADAELFKVKVSEELELS